MPHVSVRVDSMALTDGLVAALVAMGPHVRSVAVQGVDVATSQHAAATWSVERLRIAVELNVAVLAKLPRALGPFVVRCGGLILDHTLLQVSHGLTTTLITFMTCTCTLDP